MHRDNVSFHNPWGYVMEVKPINRSIDLVEISQRCVNSRLLAIRTYYNWKMDFYFPYSRSYGNLHLHVRIFSGVPFSPLIHK